MHIRYQKDQRVLKHTVTRSTDVGLLHIPYIAVPLKVAYFLWPNNQFSCIIHSLCDCQIHSLAMCQSVLRVLRRCSLMYNWKDK